MLINKNTVIQGKNVLLVPYRKEHVPKYHEWMKSEELQQLTASEPLTLEQEYEMQKSWQLDNDKCTFIILHKETFNRTKDEIESMIGDTNLFFNGDNRECAEAEIMIAERWSRKQKCGWEAMLLMFIYAIKYLQVKEFIVKISLSNIISIAMFSKFGFIETSKSEVFEETTMNKVVDTNWINWIESNLGPYEILVHD